MLLGDFEIFEVKTYRYIYPSTKNSDSTNLSNLILLTTKEWCQLIGYATAQR